MVNFGFMINTPCRVFVKSVKYTSYILHTIILESGDPMKLSGYLPFTVNQLVIGEEYIYMDIVIVAQYLCDLDHLDESNGRFVYLAKLLAEKHAVEIITTTFIHGRKKQANVVPEEYCGVKITALFEPGYPRNVCVKRFYSHNVLAKNVHDYLEKRKKPDLIYAAVPSLSVAEVAAKYCEEHQIRFVVDIQDLWPEAFKMVFKMPVISNLLFYPLERQANRIYGAADEIVAVSQTYADRAMKVNQKCKSPRVVYLGTDRNKFDEYASTGTSLFLKPSDEIWVAYIGDLSASYDIKTVIDSLGKIKSKKNIRFVAIGGGSLQKEFENYAALSNVTCTFTGHMPYPNMAKTLMECDIAVNPIKKGFAGSVINKVKDYAMAGLPVVNTQENEEYRGLLERYNAGINCICEDAGSVAEAFQKLIGDQKLRSKMSSNSRKLGEELFNRENCYQNLVHEILMGETDILNIAYCGTLGHSYDLTIVFKAMKKLPDAVLKKIRFIVMGDGPKRIQFEKLARNLPVIFTGSLAYSDMVWLLSRCNIAVNPIVPGAAQSIINKHMDYAMAGLPVINTQECLEYRNLIEYYSAGINCECGNATDVSFAIRRFVEEEHYRQLCAEGSRRMGIELFDRSNEYKKTALWLER